MFNTMDIYDWKCTISQQKTWETTAYLYKDLWTLPLEFWRVRVCVSKIFLEYKNCNFILCNNFSIHWANISLSQSIFTFFFCMTIVTKVFKVISYSQSCFVGFRCLNWPKSRKQKISSQTRRNKKILVQRLLTLKL